MTGGQICLLLATYAYMADITTPEERTYRLSILESFIPLALLVSIPGGTHLKNEFGFVVVFGIAFILSLLALLYTIFFVVDSRQRPDYKNTSCMVATEPEAENRHGPCAFSTFKSIVLSGERALLKHRPHRARTWILAIVAIFTICKFVEAGETSLWYMFCKLQYKMNDRLYSYLETYFVTLWYFSQLFLIPCLSTRLHMCDTSIIMVGAVLNIAGGLIFMVGQEIWLVFVSYTAYIFYTNMTSICRNQLT
jgi:hypothetical protein